MIRERKEKKKNLFSIKIFFNFFLIFKPHPLLCSKSVSVSPLFSLFLNLFMFNPVIFSHCASTVVLHDEKYLPFNLFNKFE